MLPLNKPYRRVLATMVVVAATVVPTGMVASLAWRVNGPGYARAVETELSQRLGMQVSVQSVRPLAPGEAEYRDLVLRREEAGTRQGVLSEVARFGRLRAKSEAKRLTLWTDELALNETGPGVLVERLLQIVGRLCREQERLELVCPAGIVRMGGSRQGARRAIGDLVAVGRRDKDGLTLSASVEMCAGDDQTRCELTARRTETAEGPVTICRIQSMGKAVPADVLDGLFASREWMGERATLEGILTTRQIDGAGGCDASFTGTIKDLDLGGLLQAQFGAARLQGNADVVLDDARWGTLPAGQGRGWIEARGTMKVRAGTIEWGMMQALAREMRFRLEGVGESDAATRRDFREFGLRFALNSQGELRLDGGLGADDPPDAVMVAGEGRAVLLRAPEGAASVHGLWNALLPLGGGVLVPATAESGAFKHLPLPPASAVVRTAVAN